MNLDTFITSLDNDTTCINSTIATIITNLKSLQNESDNQESLQYEILLLSLRTSDSARNRFLEFLVDGSEVPNDIISSQELRQYVKERMQVTKNNLLLTRYGDYLWDKFKDHNAAIIALNSYLFCATKFINESEIEEAYDCLERAIQLANVMRKIEKYSGIITTALDLLELCASNGQQTYEEKLIGRLNNFQEIMNESELFRFQTIKNRETQSEEPVSTEAELHTPEELLSGAQAFLNQSDPQLYRVAVLEAITALEAYVSIPVVR